MAISFKEELKPVLTTEEKKSRLLNLRSFHEQSFKILGVPNAQFIGKIFFINSDKQWKIKMFESEFRYGVDLYIEPTKLDYTPENYLHQHLESERELFKWTYHPAWDKEYEKLLPGTKGNNGSSVIYLLPVDDLQSVAELIAAKQKENKLTEIKKSKEVESNTVDNTVTTTTTQKLVVNSENEDCFIQQATLRDLAAIWLKKPVSNKQWLNDIVNSAR